MSLRRLAAPLLIVALQVPLMAAAAPELPDFRKLWDFDHPDVSEQRFRGLLADTAATGDVGYRCEVMTQLARSQGLQRKFDDAQATLDEAQAMLTEATPKARIRCLLERGRVWNSSGNPEASVPLFEEAFDGAAAIKEEGLAVDALHMLGIATKGDDAIRWNLAAIAYLEKAEDPEVKGWLGPLLNNLAWTYHDSGQYEKALDLFERSLAFREQEGDPRPTQIARYTVGRALRSLGRVEEALAIQQKLLAEIAAGGGDEDGYVYEEVGECLLALERDPERQRASFTRAHELLSQDAWTVENEADRLARIERLAKGEAR